jgi:hypothetical protein
MNKRNFLKYISSVLIACMLFTSFGVAFAAEATAKTSDIKGHWAENQISSWIEKGFIKGYEDGSFKPNGTITRAEFIALINRSFHFTETTEVSFKDFTSTNWAYAEIGKAIKAEYITGYADGTIGASKEITRQEAAVIIDRLLKLSTQDHPSATFTDIGLISDWAKAAVNAAVDQKIINGYAADNTFKPTQFITRAEAVATLDRAAQVKTIVPVSQEISYNTAGTFGPATGVETVTQDVYINTSGVILQNMIINGKLTFAAGIGNGDATLNNVTVKGATSVQGGGENSIHLNNSILLTITIDKKTGIVRIVAEGSTTVSQVNVNSPVTIQETNVTGAGFGNIKLTELLPKGSKVTLKGSFDNLEVVGSEIKVDIPEGSVQKVTANSTSTGMILDLGKDAKIVLLILNAVAKLLGTGTIELATLSPEAKAGTTFEKQPTKKEDTAAIVPPGITVPMPNNNNNNNNDNNNTTQYGSVTGYVYDNNGLAIAGVTVSVYTGIYDYSVTRVATVTIETDPSGKYSLSNIPVGAVYYSFIKTGFIKFENVDFGLPIVANSITNNGTIYLSSTIIYGAVIDSSEEPKGIEGVTVSVTNSDNQTVTGLTYEGGYFSLYNLPAGSYVANFSKLGYQSAAPIDIEVINGEYTFIDPVVLISQVVIDAINVIKGYAAADNADSLTISQLLAANVTGVIDANLAEYKSAIVALTATDVVTTDEIQNVINGINIQAAGGILRTLRFSSNPKDIVNKYEFQVDQGRKLLLTNNAILPTVGTNISLYATPAKGKTLLSHKVSGIQRYSMSISNDEIAPNWFEFNLSDLTINNPSIIFNYVNKPDISKTLITSTTGPTGSKSVNIVITANDSNNDPIIGIDSGNISLDLKGDNNNVVWLGLDNYKYSLNLNEAGFKVSNIDTDITDNKVSFTLTFTTDNLTDSNKFTSFVDGHSFTFDTSILGVNKAGVSATLPAANVAP